MKPVESPVVLKLPLRRRALGALACGVVLAACGHGPSALAQPSYTFSLEHIQHALAAKFPRQFKMGGLLQFVLRTPALSLRPSTQQLNALIDVQASGPLLQGRSYQGALDVDFALRYEPSDRTVRAHQLEVKGLRMEGLTPQAQELLQQSGPVMARQALQEVVLHQLSEDDLRLPSTMGLQPERFSVSERGVTLHFGPRTAP